MRACAALAALWMLAACDARDQDAESRRVSLCKRIVEDAVESPAPFRNIDAFYPSPAGGDHVTLDFDLTATDAPSGRYTAICLFDPKADGAQYVPKVVSALINGRPVSPTQIAATVARWASGGRD